MAKQYNLYNLEPYFKKYLITENFSLVSLKNYLSDFRHFAGWFDFYLRSHKKTDNSNNFQNYIDSIKHINNDTIFEYRNYLIENNLPHKTINRRLSTIRKFCSFCISQGWLKENPTKKITNIKNSHINEDIKEIQDKKALLSPKNNNIASKILEIPQLFLNKIKNFKKNNISFSKNINKQSPFSSNFNNNKNFSIQYYIALLIIIIFAASLGAGIYKQFFSKTEKLFAYPSTPTRGGRLLSFQGRLTDSLGNPITTGTNVTFKLYNVSTGGSALYTAGPCVITPDQDGIINVLIGGSGYTPTPPSSTYNVLCGNEIDSSIFTENPNVYLGITVGSDTEMTPRQQIANVGYAINAETLQGLPPGTTTSTIPFINQDGNLLIAVANPGIRSTYSSSSFTISSANSTVIQSAGLGDVILQATESGSLKFRTGGNNDSFNRLVIDNNGKVGIGTNTPSQDLEVLGNVYVNTGQLRLGNFTSSPTAIGPGSLYFNTTDSKIYYYTGSLWQEVGSGSGGGESLWQILNGAISPKNSTVDFLLGGTASSSAKFKVLNINSGTPIASISGSLTNVSLFFDGNGNISTTNRKDLILGNSSSYDSTGNILLNPNGTGNVGIGTTSPSYKLSVAGTLGILEEGASPTYYTIFQGGNQSGDITYTLPTSVISNGFLKTDASGVLSWTTTIPATSVSWSNITDPEANLILNYNTYTTTFNTSATTENFFTINTNSLTSGKGLYLSSTSTGLTGNLVEFVLSGNNTANTGNLVRIAQTGTSSAAVPLIVTNLGTGASFRINDETGDNDASPFIINATGNVGVGTTSPSSFKLQVAGHTGPNTTDTYDLGSSSLQWQNIYGKTLYQDGTAINNLFVKLQSSYPGSQQSGNLNISGVAGVDYLIDTSNSNYGIDPAGTTNFGGYSLKITSGALLSYNSGNVGIGATNPQAKLDVFVPSGTTQLGTQIINNQNNANANGLYINTARTSSDAYILNAASGETSRLYVMSNGNVGIGTTEPNHKLDVYSGNISITRPSGDTLSAILWLNQNNASSGGNYGLVARNTGEFAIYDNDASSNRIYIDSLGNVGIGGSAPFNLLDITKNVNENYIMRIRNTYNGTNRRQLVIYQGGTSTPATSDIYIAFSNDVNWGINGSISGNGSGGVQYNTTSDKRLKTNLSVVNNALNIINQITPYYFDFIFAPEKTNIGFMAQELINIYPYAVSGDPNSDPITNPMQVDYSKFTPLLIAGIKEQQNQINTLNNSLQNLFLTSTGDLNIVQTQTEEYQVQKTDSLVVNHIAAFAKIIVGKIKAGLIETQELIIKNNLNAKSIITESLNIATNNILIAGKTIEQFIDERIESVINSRFLSTNQEILSPIIETKDLIATGAAQLNKIQTNEIHPQNQNLVIDLSENNLSSEDPSPSDQNNNEDNKNNKGELAKLIIKGLEGKTAVIIDASGNASFSGQIVAQSLSINNDATISGNLIAENAQINNLQTNQASISGNLTARTINAENIDSLSQELETTKTDINEIQRLIAEIKNQNPTNPENYQNLTNEDNITLANLNVTGQTNLYNLSVSNSLLVNSIYIENNSIISLASELKIRALEKIDFFDGGLTIAKDGKLTVKGEIIAQSGIKTNQISLLDNQLTIKNNQGETIANFDSSGSAYFKNLSLEKFTPATPSSVLIAADLNFQENGIFAPALKTASASAGVGLIPQSSQEIIIYNDNIKKDSLIYITPVDNNLNNNFNVSKNYCQENNISCQPYFKVFINQPTIIPLKFNWLIVN